MIAVSIAQFLADDDHLDSICVVGHHYDFPVDECTSAAQVSIFLAVICAVIGGVSRWMGDLILALVGKIIELVAMKPDGNMDPLQARTLKQLPKTLHGALSRFSLDGRTTIYAACPACHYTYKPHAKLGCQVYPEHCTNQPKPEAGPCGEPLLEDREPIKPFVYHHFADYLAGLLSQHEEEMDKACDDGVQFLHHPPPTFINSIFDADFIRTFKGPDSKHFFIDRPGKEGRYLFTLNVDFFNVEGMRIRGASSSCGIIALACLNLPLDIRYKPENMYLAIIPGPVEPSLTDLNHYMRPIIDDMVDAWQNGIRFTRTPREPDGRDTRSAIAAVVNDLPAARKAAALAGHKSHFYCSICACYGSTRGCTDFHNWRVRDHSEMRKHAEAWRDATSSVERDKLFQAHGVRWSELWRLPYWDPPRQLVVDSMHCILEGLGQYHSRTLLGLTMASALAKSPDMPAYNHTFHKAQDHTQMNEREVSHIPQIHNLLLAPVEGSNLSDIAQNLKKLSDKLLKKNFCPLKFVLDDLGLTVALDPKIKRRYKAVGGVDGTTEEQPVILKAELVAALVAWVCPKYSSTVSATESNVQRRTKPMNTTCIQQSKIATPEVIQRIRDVVKDTVSPSWLNSVPHNFGDAAAGTLKADEWRTMWTVYLPIALVSLWGVDTSHQSTADTSQKLRDVLDHSMALASAITLACMRTMTRARATAYRTHVVAWVRDLERLYPNIKHRTNNHMAIHIYDFLILFGPVRSWWCFPFERLIGQLQRLHTNHKFGGSS